MKKDDITNQQLLEALTDKFDKRFDGLEQRFDGLEQSFNGLTQRFDSLEQSFIGLTQRLDSLEEMLAGVQSVVIEIADTMATSEELNNLELRLGRRIDAALVRKSIR